MRNPQLGGGSLVPRLLDDPLSSLCGTGMAVGLWPRRREGRVEKADLGQIQDRSLLLIGSLSWERGRGVCFQLLTRSPLLITQTPLTGRQGRSHEEAKTA